MQKIGLFGGTFDPIHNGHLHIAQAFYQELGLDKVIFLPAGNPYHKNAPQISKQHRLKMVELAIQNFPQFEVDTFDLDRSEYTYTYDTVCFFKNKYPQTDLWFLLGSDSLINLEHWYRWQDLVKNIKIAVAARSEHNFAADLSPLLSTWYQAASTQQRLLTLHTPLHPHQSRTLRSLFQNHHPHLCQAQLPPSVYNYILTHRLYVSTDIPLSKHSYT